MKYLILIINLLITSTSLAVQKQIEIKTKIYRNTASNIFPSLTFVEGVVATFKIIYDDQLTPIFSGKLLMNPDGTPQLDTANQISYDTSISSNSTQSNESRYTISGIISLEIDGNVWTGSNCNVIIYNDMPTLTKFDAFFIECDLINSQMSGDNIHRFQSIVKLLSANPQFVNNTSLPKIQSDVDTSGAIEGTFDLSGSTPGTSWYINSNNFQSITIQPIN